MIRALRVPQWILSRRLITIWRDLWALRPQGSLLPPESWTWRHIFLVRVLWGHALIYPLIGTATGNGFLHSVFESSFLALLAIFAQWPGLNRRIRSALVSTGLLTASALLVHFSGGYIEMHFHFFVMIALIMLYQDWIPFLIALAYVFIHHGLLGMLYPFDVYNHPSAWQSPWLWALIHAVFILAQSLANIISWSINERLRAQTDLIVNAVGEGICGIDGSGRICFINPAGARMLGWQADEMVGKPAPLFFQAAHGQTSDPHDSGPASDRATDQATLGRSSATAGEQLARHKDGTRFPIESTRAAVLNAGDGVSLVLTFQDVRDRKRREEELRRAHAEAQDAIRLRDNFLSVAAHELKTPLTAILGNLQLLARRAARGTLKPGQEQQILGLLQDQARRTTRLFDDLLDVSRLEFGQLNLIMEPVDIVALVRQLLDELQIDQQRHQVLLTIPDRTLLVHGDALRLQQVLSNLLQNAMKYSPQGGPISISVADAGSNVRIQIQDQGIGVPAHVIPHLFRRFYRAENGRVHGIPGLGIGLYIVKEIISLHGGTIQLESVESHGTLVTIRLPMLVPGQPRPPSQTETGDGAAINAT